MKYNLTGQTFAYLTVISRNEDKRKKSNVFWNCKCVCGKIVAVDSSNLRRGCVKSCGCQRYNRHATQDKRQQKAAEPFAGDVEATALHEAKITRAFMGRASATKPGEVSPAVRRSVERMLRRQP